MAPSSTPARSFGCRCSRPRCSQYRPASRSAGRVRVGTDLRVVGTDDAWSAGDCAAVPDLTNRGVTTPPTAQHAVRQARHLADNLVAVLRGQSVRPYAHRYAGSIT